MRQQMHADEVTTDRALIRALLIDQFPDLAELPIERVDSAGTDHDIYRLGDRLAARLPRIGWATRQAALEAQWLPRLAPHLPLAVPEPIAIGRPAFGYPFDWSIVGWLPGASVADRPLADLDRAADDLAKFVLALRRIDTSDAPARRAGRRGGPLCERDVEVRRAIGELGERIDGAAALRSWEASLAADEHGDAAGVWIHADLLPGNLLAVDGRLSAAIDFGGLTVGDPACDLLPAWNVFTGASRERYRAALDADDAAWQRGRGWALCQAVVALPYYWDTNPPMIRQASHALTQLLDG